MKTGDDCVVIYQHKYYGEYLTILTYGMVPKVSSCRIL